MKFKVLFVSTLVAGLLAGCGADDDQAAEDQTTDTTQTETEETDVVTAASITGDEDVFVAALGEEGTWIVAALNDMTIEKELVVAGQFHNKDDASEAIYRKLALYTQDDDKNVTGTFTLTIPKMTVQSENFKIQNGTVKGDVHVEANGFTLTEDTTIDGNLTFASEEVKESAVIEGTVTGTQEVK
ncbi:polymer-forming cytoskeletal protein [Bacillus sp. V3B]|uniref:polymer-forming cytoskeletal protein n=1 Tax=Bacillus sp. V3B TaxID=2804915 RepID=UPI00210DE930|nr:polymer-forming cytoskeletal protein [Bacillus sp. V3B]MCQ6276117.1 polymer-forming cytoskeletal protein [Bacillus sp. V3B]